MTDNVTLAWPRTKTFQQRHTAQEVSDPCVTAGRPAATGSNVSLYLHVYGHAPLSLKLWMFGLWIGEGGRRSLGSSEAARGGWARCIWTEGLAVDLWEGVCRNGGRLSGGDACPVQLGVFVYGEK